MTEPTRGGDCAGDAQVSAVNPFNRSAAWPLYLGSDSNFHRFVSFWIALHLDNTFSENDYRQLSCLA
jgi:hypothetical protein